MGEQTDKQPEPEKPAPLPPLTTDTPPSVNTLVIEETAKKVPYWPAIKAFFYREGKIVKSGWLICFVIAGFSAWAGYKTTSIFANIKVEQLNTQNSQLQGELKDAKQDRDKYQVMLAPFQAMALKLYTNAPVEDRLNLFSSLMFTISTNFIYEVERDRPRFDIYINNEPVTNHETISIKSTKELLISAENKSPISASGLVIDFSIPPGITETNLDFGTDWQPEPPTMAVSSNIYTTNHYCPVKILLTTI